MKRLSDARAQYQTAGIRSVNLIFIFRPYRSSRIFHNPISMRHFSYKIS
jgi:hypothetical protein